MRDVSWWAVAVREGEHEPPGMESVCGRGLWAAKSCLGILATNMEHMHRRGVWASA